jgi:NADPH:quinone reductase-like Zn-dependent oxidoreductase
VDYTSGPFAEQLAGADKFDVVFDFVGGTDAEKGAEQVLRRGGKFITAVGPMRAIGDRKLSFFEWHGWALSLIGRILVRKIDHLPFACGSTPPIP